MKTVDDRRPHVMPEDEAERHVFNMTCPCGPRVEEGGGEMKLFRLFLYRPIMRIAHRFNWHYAPPLYPDGDTQLWCRWCGFRQTVKRKEWK